MLFFRFSIPLRAALRFVLIVLATLALTSFSANAARLALVIGNDNYEHHPKLRKAGNDADAMAGLLKRAGFEIVNDSLRRDLTRSQMNAMFTQLIRRINGGDEVVVFFSGHGLQYGDVSLLTGRDFPKPFERTLALAEAVQLRVWQDEIKRKGARFALFVIDACREDIVDDPMVRSLGEASTIRLAQPPAGQFVLFSASSGQLALDRLSDSDLNPNSVFTRVFLEEAQRPGVAIRDVLEETKERVELLAATVKNRATGLPHEQRPASRDEAGRAKYCLFGQGALCGVSPSPAAVQRVDPEEEAYNIAKSRNTRVAWEALLAVYPNGRYGGVARIALAAPMTPPPIEQRPTPVPAPTSTPAPALAVANPAVGNVVRDIVKLNVRLELARIKPFNTNQLAIAKNGLFATSARSLTASADRSNQTDVLLHDSEVNEIARLVAAENSITSLRFSPDDLWLAATDYNANCHLWNVRERTLVRSLAGSSTCRWMPGSSDQMLIGQKFGGVGSHTRSTGHTRIWAQSARHYVRHLGSDGLVVTDKDDALWFWRKGPDFAPTKFDLPKNAYVAFGDRYFYVGTETEIRIVDRLTAKPIKTYRHGLQTNGEFASFSVRPSPDEQFMLIVMNIGPKTTVQCVGLAELSVIYQETLRESSIFESLRGDWSPDGTIFAFNYGYDSTGNKPRVAFLDVRRRALGTAEGRFAAPIIFSANGRRVRSPAGEYFIE